MTSTVSPARACTTSPRMFVVTATVGTSEEAALSPSELLPQLAASRVIATIATKTDRARIAVVVMRISFIQRAYGATRPQPTQNENRFRKFAQPPTLTTMSPVITTTNLGVAYDGVPALSDVNIQLPAGTSLAVIGPKRLREVDTAGRAGRHRGGLHRLGIRCWSPASAGVASDRGGPKPAHHRSRDRFTGALLDAGPSAPVKPSGSRCGRRRPSAPRRARSGRRAIARSLGWAAATGADGPRSCAGHRRPPAR